MNKATEFIICCATAFHTPGYRTFLLSAMVESPKHVLSNSLLYPINSQVKKNTFWQNTRVWVIIF